MQIADFIAVDNPTAAEHWVESLIELANRAAALPFSGRRVPEVGRDDVREFLLRSYRLVYRVLDQAVDVLTVFEGHRLLPVEIIDGIPDERDPR